MPIDKKISVILPTYNEKVHIALLIDTIHNVLSAYSHEILVVDGNSPDGTYQAVAGLRHPYVKAILRTENSGLAESIRCGLEYARGEIFAVMDSDFNHQPRYLSFMIQSLAHYDCVCASRFLCGGKMNSHARQILSRIFNAFIRLMTGSRLTDNLYGFFVIKREQIQRCHFDDIFRGYGDYYMRLLQNLQKNDVTILEIPAVSGGSEGMEFTKILRIFWRYLLAVVQLSCRIRAKAHVQRDKEMPDMR